MNKETTIACLLERHVAVDGKCRGCGKDMRPKEPAAFKPTWPEGLQESTLYEIACDDKGRNGTCWMRVMVAGDGDCHVSMHENEDGDYSDHLASSVYPGIRIRTGIGGGRNKRTRQALLWLADAIRRDNEENGVTPCQSK